MDIVEKKKLEIVKASSRRITRVDVIEERFLRMEQYGIIFLDSDIEEGTPSITSLALLSLQLDLPKNKPMWVVLNSPGGIVDQGLAIYDMITMLKKVGRTVNVLSMGCVASMATCVLQAGSRRYSMPNTRFLLHEVSQYSIGREKVSEGKERVAESERLNDIVMSIIAKRVGIKLDDLKRKTTKKEYWLNASEALKLGNAGLIDEVIDSLPFLL